MKNAAPLSPLERAGNSSAPCKACCFLIAAVLVACMALFASPASAADLEGANAVDAVGGKVSVSVQKTRKAARDIARAKASRVKSVVYTGKSVKPKLKLTYAKKRLKAGRDYRVSYKSNVKAGMAKIVVRGRGSYKGKKTIAFKIVKARVSKLTVASIKDRTYTGSPIKVSPAVSYNGKKLKKGKDYTLSYKSNVKAGKAVVTIHGMGNFSSTRKVRFTVKPASLAKAKVASISSKYTTGLSAVKPLPTVKYCGRTLVQGVDYKLSYSNNVLPGTATVTVKPKSGNFTDAVAKTFKLVNMGDDLARAACKVSYSTKVKKGKGTKEFIAACKAAGCYSSPYYGRSCILGMCTAIRTSGYDTGFPKYNWINSWASKSTRSYFHYLKKGEKSSDVSQKSPRWTYVGTYPADESKLLPGDVLVVLRGNNTTTNHIWMYVGNDIPKEVYKKHLKGTDADKGEPTGAWVQAHAYNKSAPSIEGPNTNYNKSPNPVRIYRCTSPENKG